MDVLFFARLKASILFTPCLFNIAHDVLYMQTFSTLGPKYTVMYIRWSVGGTEIYFF